MATGGNFSRTLEGGHEPFYDFPCSLCEGEGRHVEAVKYCEECLVYLCDPCVRNHNKFPLHKRHQLLDESQFAKVNKPALVSFPTKRCQKHPGELINIFCGNHDVVCCSVCKALEHSNCVKTQHLPDAAKGIQTSKEYQTIKTGTRAMISDLDKVLNNRKAAISRIAKEKQRVTQTIAEFRKKVNRYFDDLERNTLTELDHREKTISRGIDQDKNYLETTKSKTENILKELESFKGANECDLFVQVKTGWHFLNEALERLGDICKTDDKSSIHFKINRSIEEFIASLNSLGSFSSTHSGEPLLSAPSYRSVLPTRKSSPDKEFKYKAQCLGKFYVNEKSDKHICNIWSICQLPDDTFLITDSANNRLKRLNQTLDLMDYVELSDSAQSVCVTGPGQAAVSVCSEKKIQFVSVGKKLKLTRSFTVGNKCRGVAYIGNELFVCCGSLINSSSGCIEVYSNAGQLQRTIPRAPQRLSALHITASDDGQHVFTTSWESDVITMLDLTGNVVNTFNHKSLKEPRGICTDGRGQVFVCGYDSDTVVQLSPKHQKIEVILTEADGIKYPRSVYYDRSQSRLLVSCQLSNELFVFTMK